MTSDPRRALTVLADDNAAIACTLDAGELDERMAEWQAVAAEARSREPIEGGLRLAFDEIDVRALTDLAIREHECCSFLSFSVGIGTAGTTLDITGPEAVRELIDAFG
jgi:hypothetical protein